MGICTYNDTAIVRFTPNPRINFPSVNTCFNPESNNNAQSYVYLSSPFYLSTQIPGAAGTVASGTTVTMNVISQPVGVAIAFSHIDNNVVMFIGINVWGASLTAANSCDSKQAVSPEAACFFDG